MDPEHTDDVLNHLEKQHELLSATRNTITHELQKLEVEEEMMMRKFYELMSTLNKKKMEETQNVSQGKEIVEVEAEASATSSTHKGLVTYVRRKKNQKPTQ